MFAKLPLMVQRTQSLALGTPLHNLRCRKSICEYLCRLGPGSDSMQCYKGEGFEELLQKVSKLLLGLSLCHFRQRKSLALSSVYLVL